MKKIMFILLLVGSIQGLYAQNTEKSKKFMVDKTLFEELTDVKKKSDKFNLYLNMQGSFDANFRDGFEQGAFKMRQLRIEMKGNINNWLSYRYRQRLNRSGERLDHLIMHRCVVRSIRFAEPLLQHRVVRVVLDLHGQRLPHLLEIFLVAKLAAQHRRARIVKACQKQLARINQRAIVVEQNRLQTSHNAPSVVKWACAANRRAGSSESYHLVLALSKPLPPIPVDSDA